MKRRLFALSLLMCLTSISSIFIGARAETVAGLANNSGANGIYVEMKWPGVDWQISGITYTHTYGSARGGMPTTSGGTTFQTMLLSWPVFGRASTRERSMPTPLRTSVTAEMPDTGWSTSRTSLGSVAEFSPQPCPALISDGVS